VESVPGDREGGHLGVTDLDASGVVAGVELPVPVVVAAMDAG
jgi:hypothetical protein